MMEQNEEKIRKMCEDPVILKFYLVQNSCNTLDQCFKKQRYQKIICDSAQKKLNKRKEFENKEINYLVDLLKKLKKIFNKAKKEKDLKQLKYLDQKINNLMKDKNYIRINFNGGIAENKICHDFGKIQFEVRKEIRLQGEN